MSPDQPDQPTLDLEPIESLTWEQLEAERRAFLDKAVAQGLTFEQMPHDEILRFVAVSHRARLMVKPAGKPSGKPKALSKKAKTLDDLIL